MKAFRALYGYNYVQNGWMGDIYSLNVDNVSFLRATISPSQPGVGRLDYKTWVAISEDCSVLTGHCMCPAGNAKSCSHISALLYAVVLAWSSGVAGTTCTDKTQAWGKGAAKSLTHEKVIDITFDRPSSQVLQDTSKKFASRNITPDTQQFLDHKDLQESIEQSAVKDLWNVKGTMLYKVLNAPEESFIEQTDISHACHDISSDRPVKSSPCHSCEQFFKKYVRFPENKIIQLNSLTQSQNSTLWMDSRKLRITASRANAVPKSNRANPDKFINNQLYQRFKGCAVTRHGQKSEPKAREWFEAKTGQIVTKSGITIHPDEPYFAASPDGLVGEDTILEIKCPTRPLQELVTSGKYDVTLKDGQLILNPKGVNGYYCQVQMTMFCTKRSLCKFVLWTPDEQCIMSVPFSMEYMSGVLPRLRNFYFHHLLVRMTEEHYNQRLKISREYQKICC
ncbi:uncharacterized protein LOC123543310 isoform X2 [Mercenaria mercenaria]|nr:uncharacterized protein LOC123543310 isoform X2 [Mercenaria mercenaria]